MLVEIIFPSHKVTVGLRANFSTVILELPPHLSLAIMVINHNGRKMSQHITRSILQAFFCSVIK